MASKLTLILNDVAARVMGLGLLDPIGGDVIPVVIRKLPRRQEGIDSLPLIVVYRSDAPEDYKRMAFGGIDSIEYLIYIVLITQGNQDLVSYIDALDAIRDQIESAFKRPNIPAQTPLLANVPGCWDLKTDPDVFLPRQQVNINYDYTAMAVHVSVTKTD